jgi:hypothetical protein
MPVALTLAVVLLAFLVAGGLRRRGDAPARPENPLRQLVPTGRRLYTRRNFLKLIGATAGGAVISYSGLDEAVEELHRSHVTGVTSDNIAHLAKEFGENGIALAGLSYALADWALPGTAIGRWGRECFTATATGLPVLWTWQRALGGSRPSDGKQWGPRYRPFTDENSVSGHTFVGAVPFLVAARHVGMPVAAWGLRALSPMTGWSRLNDERHYLSQVLLGYGLAFEATRAADLSPSSSAIPTSPESDRAPA